MTLEQNQDEKGQKKMWQITNVIGPTTKGKQFRSGEEIDTATMPPEHTKALNFIPIGTQPYTKEEIAQNQKQVEELIAFQDASVSKVFPQNPEQPKY